MVAALASTLVNTERLAELGGATLAAATALNPILGYDRTAELVSEAHRSGRSLRDVATAHRLDPGLLDATLGLRRLAAGGLPEADLAPSAPDRLEEGLA